MAAPCTRQLLEITPDGQLLVTAGPGGVLAISRTGEQLWRREGVRVTDLAVSRQYVVARTDRERLDVYALDGTPLGPVYTPGRVLAFALSSESSLLVATDDRQNMIAWQLPPPHRSKDTVPRGSGGQPPSTPHHAPSPRPKP